MSTRNNTSETIDKAIIVAVLLIACFVLFTDTGFTIALNIVTKLLNLLVA